MTARSLDRLSRGGVVCPRNVDQRWEDASRRVLPLQRSACSCFSPSDSTISARPPGRRAGARPAVRLPLRPPGRRGLPSRGVAPDSGPRGRPAAGRGRGSVDGPQAIARAATRSLRYNGPAEMVTLNEAASVLGVCAMTVRRLIGRRATQAAPSVPWSIRRSALDEPSVREAVQASKDYRPLTPTARRRTKNLRIPGM